MKSPSKAKSGGAEERTDREAVLTTEVLQQAQDYEKLAVISAELSDLAAEREKLELEWLETMELERAGTSRRLGGCGRGLHAASAGSGGNFTPPRRVLAGTSRRLGDDGPASSPGRGYPGGAGWT